MMPVETLYIKMRKSAGFTLTPPMSHGVLFIKLLVIKTEVKENFVRM